MITNDSNPISYSLPTEGTNSTLDTVTARSFMKIYCACGRIVGLDKKEIQLKKKLGKEIECISCRNSRISLEIDEMNSYFDGVSEEDKLWSF